MSETKAIFEEISREIDKDITEGLRCYLSAYTGDLKDTAKIQRIDVAALVALQGLLAGDLKHKTRGLEHHAFEIAGRFEDAREAFFSGINKNVNGGRNWRKVP